MLSISEYNARETEARIASCNRIVEAFSPSHFNAFGYPTRVQENSELFKFADVMQERRFEHYIDQTLGGLSEDEYQQFLILATQVAEMCQKRFLRKGCGKSSIAHSINVLRHIRYLSENQPATVFEIGPGCGYLGAMLTASGYGYMAYDVTQAFYLYQSNLWSYLYGARAIDLAHTPLSSLQLDQLLAKRGEEAFSIHLPWWELIKLPQGRIPTVDIITCNHVLCEMHNASLSFTAKLARLMLEQSKGPRLVVFEGWGWHATNRITTVAAELYKLGFVLLHHDPSISVLGLRTDVRPGQYPELEQVVATGGLAWHRGSCYVDEGVNRFEGSAISQKLTSARQLHQQHRNIRASEVLSRLVSLVGEEAIATEDERFFDFIERPNE